MPGLDSFIVCCLIQYTHIDLISMPVLTIKRGKNKGSSRVGLIATDYIEQILEPYLLP